MDEDEALNLIRTIVEADPTKGKYSEWLVKQYKDDKIIVPEDNPFYFFLTNYNM